MYWKITAYRFLATFAIALGAFCGIYYATVHFVDPYGESGTGIFPVLVLDSRRAKLQLLPRFIQEGATGGIILGSSRSLLMRPEALSNEGTVRIFNFAVDNAHAEDFLAIYHYALAHGIAPSFILIGLDISSLHSDDLHDPMFDRSELRNYLQQGGANPSRAPLQPLLDAKASYTKDYLKDTFKAVVMKLRRQTPKTKFRSDGYELQYSGAQLPSRDIEPQHEFDEDVRSYRQRLSGMDRLSPERLRYLGQLFAEARSRGTTIIVWLTPIHPRLHELITASTNYGELVSQVNAEGNTWTSKYGVYYRDYSDIRTFGGLEFAWSDATHMDVRNMDRVAHAIMSEAQHGF